MLNGTIQQTNEVLQNQTRQAEKGMVDQGNIYAQEVKKEYQNARQVVRSDQTILKEERFDAKEKGNGTYQKREQKKKQSGNKPAEDKVVIKGQSTGFDIKI